MWKQNIKSNLDFTIQRLRHIKGVLGSNLSANLDNIVLCLWTQYVDIEIWVYMDGTILGDTLVIHGDQNPDIKLVSVVKFTYQ